MLSELSNFGRLAVITGSIVAGAVSVNAMSAPRSSVAPTPPAAEISQPTVRQETADVKTVVPFETQTVEHGALTSGTTRTNREGVNGGKTAKFLVVYSNDIEVSRTLISETVTTQPVAKIIANGTYVAPPPQPVRSRAPRSSSCDPNYSGCVPIASDVDCQNGSGNGPAYVAGPVNVIGSDIYDLDRDGNGVACE